MERCQKCGYIKALDNGVCLDCAIATVEEFPTKSRTIHIPCGDGNHIEINVFGIIDKDIVIQKLLDFITADLEQHHAGY